jgi:hypothetical protein
VNLPGNNVPRRAALIWFGGQFPWLNVLAVRSAAIAGGFDEVVLHHDSDLSGTPHYEELVGTPKVVLRRFDLDALVSRCDRHADELRKVWDRLKTPVARSELFRLAYAYGEGGVYLDIDTVTVKSLEPISSGATAFCGEERIVYPGWVRESKNPVVLAQTFARDRARDLLRRLPRGYRTFRKIEHLYPSAANCAILGSARKSEFLEFTFDLMFRLPPEVQAGVNAIGPLLFQNAVESYRGSGLVIHPPAVFYPLGPEISQHWFRMRDSVDLSEVILPETRVVHWYGSVRAKELMKTVNPDYVRKNAKRQFFSAMALPFLA